MFASHFLMLRDVFRASLHQLRRQMLGLLKPAVALKKSTVVRGRQFTGSMFILLKGTLQVSQAPEEDGKTSERSGTSDGSSPALSRGSSKLKGSGNDEPKGKLKRANTKGFKDKLKVRMLEKPGSIIPLDNVLEGPKASPFSVFAVTRCQMLMLETSALRAVLQVFPVPDANVVKDAISAEFKNLTDSLKMTKSADGNMRASKTDGDTDNPALKKRQSVTERESVQGAIIRMEAHASRLTQEVDDLTQQTVMLPEILKVLTRRVGGSSSNGQPPPDVGDKATA